MDLLGSILGTMDKPPQASEEQRQKLRKEKELAQKQAAKEKMMKQRFREKAEEKINNFVRDGEAKTFKFPPMDKFQRSIIHDVAEIAGLVAFSFGEEDVDRYLQVWKKEFSPCEGEIAALRRGEVWDPVKFKQKQAEEEWREKLELERARTINKIVPKTDYKEKYEHLIGREAAVGAARKTEANANKVYGMVSAEQKKDKRTVEQVQAEIRAKKRLKREAEAGLNPAAS